MELRDLTDLDRDKHLFKTNIEALAKLGSHSNIVGTLDFFEDNRRRDTFYEVTESIRGRRLDQIMQDCQQPLALKEQLFYLKPLCQALKHAHVSNVYHRNLNPKSIFVEEDTVKLADFDFAKVIDRHTIASALDRHQQLISQVFLAPELRNNPTMASPASDIYSLGMLWYHLVSLPTQNPEFGSDQPDVYLERLSISDDAKKLMGAMLSRAIAHRPKSVEKVLARLDKLE